jgi:hypothetical protein
MFLSATSEIRVEISGSDVAYLLPSRPLGKRRRMATELRAALNVPAA